MSKNVPQLSFPRSRYGEIRTTVFGGPWNIVLDGERNSPQREGEGSAFDAAFTKLLWPLFMRLRACHSHAASVWPKCSLSQKRLSVSPDRSSSVSQCLRQRCVCLTPIERFYRTCRRTYNTSYQHT